METLSISGAESSNKRNRVAAVTSKSGKDATIPATPSNDACKHWATETGCKRGKNCGFSHAMEKPGKCWVCGGGHQKADCVDFGGGKGPVSEAKSKAKIAGTPKPESPPKGSGKSPATPKTPPTLN